MKWIIVFAYIALNPYVSKAFWTAEQQGVLQSVQHSEELHPEGNPEQNQSVYVREALGLAFSKIQNLKDFSAHPFSHQKKWKIPFKKTHFDKGIYDQESCAPSPQNNFLPARGRWQKKTTDLIVLVPGLFAQSSGISPTRLFNLLYQNGYHVFALPNPFSAEYIHQYPRDSSGSFKKEAKIVLEAMEYLINSNASKIKKVHLVGMSYGAFLSAVALVLDKKKIISGKTFLLSPQVQFSTTILKLLDPLIKESLEAAKFNKTKAGPVQKIFRRGAGIKIYNGTLYTNINLFRKYKYHKKHAFKCAAYSPGAIASFERVLNAYNMQGVDFNNKALATKKEPWIFPWKVNPHYVGLQLWAKQLSVWSTFQDYAYDTHIYYIDNPLLNISKISTSRLEDNWMLKGLSNRSSQNFAASPDTLAYWLHLAYKKGHDNFSVFTTEDDFTNFSADWSKPYLFPKYLKVKKHFQQWKKGSHLGYFSKSWFKKVLYMAFPKK
ncbi:MAG: hypothetical protein HAW63_04520 [Bdellovibrionaceae bacterium]|nr:hypothetical protein [Pseudobdellovibrionaceae bacterium]